METRSMQVLIQLLIKDKLIIKRLFYYFEDQLNGKQCTVHPFSLLDGCKTDQQHEEGKGLKIEKFKLNLKEGGSAVICRKN